MEYFACVFYNNIVIITLHTSRIGFMVQLKIEKKNW